MFGSFYLNGYKNDTTKSADSRRDTEIYININLINVVNDSLNREAEILY